MKTNLVFLLILGFLINGCNIKSGSRDHNVWTKSNISKYILKLPEGYVIHYSADSLHIIISNKRIKIEFEPGDFNVDGIESSKQVISKERINSFKKILLKSTKKNETSLSACIWDTVAATHLFNDTKYNGCILSADNLTDRQQDTVIMIFNSLTPRINK